MVGRLESYKRIDRAIGALDGLRADWQLVVVGDGPARGELQRLVAEAGHTDRVLFTGRIDEGELRRWQRTATVTVCLSDQEAFGLVLAESLVAGSPVVASDIPAHREVAESAGGRIVLVPAATSPGDLARHITGAVDAPVRGANGEGVLDWSEVAGRTQDIYRSVTSSAVAA